jgi:nucleoside-diphosphate-sugar epimerase
MQGLPLPITGSGDETRDFTYVEDIVDGLLRVGAIEKAVGEEINLASGKETRIIDLARMINDLTGNKAGIRTAQRRKWDTKSRRLASISKAQELVDYKPNTSLEVGLTSTVRWFTENWERIKLTARFEPGASSAVREVSGIEHTGRGV